MASNYPIRVIKLGGSLLDLTEVFQRLEGWIDVQPVMHNVLIVGGGKLVDGLRDLHQRFDLDEREAHWLAVDLLDVTAKIASSHFPSWTVHRAMIDLLGSCNSDRPANQIFVTGQWLRTQPLVPQTWHVTTDSISALVAHRMSASELVLLKSAAADSLSVGFEPTISRLVDSGHVDAWFPTAIQGVNKIRLVNLRDDAFAETILCVDQQ